MTLTEIAENTSLEEIAANTGANYVVAQNLKTFWNLKKCGFKKKMKIKIPLLGPIISLLDRINKLDVKKLWNILS